MPSIFSSSCPTRLHGNNLVSACLRQLTTCMSKSVPTVARGSKPHSALDTDGGTRHDVGRMSYKINTYVDGPRLLRGLISGRVHGALILEHLQQQCQ